MRSWKLLSVISTFLAFTSVCLAQAETGTPDPTKEQAKKEADERVVQMLDQVLSDASLLRLPQNKAIVYAMAADMYWKFDEKKSRDLFRSAAGEILAYNIDRERDKADITDGYMDIFDPGDPRGQVLPLVAKHDGEMALELLVQTRPAALAEAILKASAPDARTDMMGYPDNMRVRRELDLEQQFALLAANENPERAVKLIRDSLSKGVTHNVLQLLQRLHRKDEKKASELAGEVIRKFVDLDLSRRGEELQTAISFLQTMVRETPASGEGETKNKAFRFTETQIKDLANKLVSTFLASSNSVAITTSLSRAMSTLEKIVPDKVALLKQRMGENRKNLPTEFRNMDRMQKLWDPNSTPEQILAEVPKMQNEMERMNAYQSVANKIGQIDDEARAKKIIDQIGDEKARTRAQEQYDSAKIARVVSAGKLEEARKMIGALTNKRMQIQKLVALAAQVHKKGTEADIEAARDLMKHARSLINESPEDEDELNSLMDVVRGYATVEPDAAFRLFEPIVDQINDIVHASAILSKYNKRNRSFKKGELILKANTNPGDGILLFRYLNQIQLLGKADLARTGSLSDRFQRSDARALVKLVALQGFSKDDSKHDIPVAPSGFVYFEN